MARLILQFSIIAYTFAASANDSLTLITTTGQAVQVSADEVVHAYNSLDIGNERESDFNRRVTNDDGSITVLNPQISYAGKMYPLQGHASATPETESNEVGFCRLQKLGPFQSIENDWSGSSAGDSVVHLNAEGQILGTLPADLYLRALNVTCAHK